MIEMSQCLGLMQEAALKSGIARVFVLQQLDGHLASEGQVIGAIDVGHRAAAEWLDQAVSIAEGRQTVHGSDDSINNACPRSPARPDMYNASSCGEMAIRAMLLHNPLAGS